MAAAFNPYAAWLGVRLSGRAPNHYELLGLPLFESEPPYILDAVELQTSRLAPHLAGEHAALAQRLLGEIGVARDVLLNPAARRQYDATLVGGHVPLVAATPALAAWQPAVAAAAIPTAVMPVASSRASPGGPSLVPLVSATAPRIATGRGNKKSDLVLVLALGAVVIGLAGVAAWAILGGNGSSATQTADATEGAGERSAESTVTPKTTGRKRSLPTAEAKAPAKEMTEKSNEADSKAEKMPAKDAEASTEPKPADDPKPEPTPPQPTPPKPNPGDKGTKRPDEKTPTEGTKSGDNKMPAKDGEPATDPEEPLPDVEDVFAVKKELGMAREQLGKRNLETAQEHIDQATLAATAPVLEREVEQMQNLHGLLKSFWDAVGLSVLKLKAAEEIDVNGQVAIVVEASEDRLVYKQAGKMHRETMADLPRNLAIVLAEKSLKKDDPNAKLAVAAFLMFDRKGDRGKARKLFDEARSQGADVDGLLGDLAGASN